MSNRGFLIGILLLASLSNNGAAAAETPLAFPGAMGAAATTPGGRGGEVVRVTTLAATGPGSFVEAVKKPGPRIVVFEVGGVIDLGESVVRITEPFLTIAGQTAPYPGITLIRGGIDITSHDVVIRHIRVRPGDGGRPRLSGNDYDSISTIGAHDVIVDHCSLMWATDENLSASGPRFTGKTPDEWRKGTSHRITFSNNLIAEGLANSVHVKGEHSKGSLIHDNVSDILIINNLYSNNKERNPLFKGGVRGAIVNNLIYNPGQRAIHYNLIAEEWRDHAFQTGEMTVIGNVLRAGQSTVPNLPLVTVGGSGDLALYERDNIAVDRWGGPLPLRGSYTNAPVKILKLTPPTIAGVQPMPAREVQDHVIRNAGAFHWRRDYEDARIVADVIEGRGDIIDSQTQTGGYPRETATFQAFDPSKWNLADMTPR
jgi:pectate lyase